MKEIPLTRGKVAFVDDGDYEFLSQFKWFAVNDKYNWYAKTVSHGRVIGMHRLVLFNLSVLKVDHIDRNGLNNQRKNLRECTHQQNLRNMFRSKQNKSGFKGVCWHRCTGKWIAQIKVPKTTHLGCFTDKREAAKAYDKAALEYFGRFALTNKKLGLL